MKKYLKLLLVCFSFFFLPSIYKAEEATISFKDYDNIVSKVVSTGSKANLRIPQINNSIAYTLNAEEELLYHIALRDDEFLESIEPDKLEYMRKIAKHGYNLLDDDYYMYMAAQELIWELMMDKEIIWEDMQGNEISVELQKEKILSRIAVVEDFETIKLHDVHGLYLDDINIGTGQSVYSNIKINNKTRNQIIKWDDKINLIVHETTNDPIEIIKEYKIGYETAVFKPTNSGRLITFDATKKYIEKINVFMENKVNSYIEINFINNGEAIDGIVTFELIGKENNVFKTDNNGHFVSNETFEEGIYEINIIEVPDSYVLDDSELKITIKDDYINSEQRVNYTQNIELKTGNLELVRYGKIETGKVLVRESEFELYRVISKHSELIGIYKTDEYGMIKVNNLPIGNYYLLEKNVSGFERYADKVIFEIKKQHEIIKKEIITNHLPLKIIVNEKQGYNYYLVNESNNIIKKIRTNELNKIFTEYGNYNIEIYKDDKKIFTWDLLFDEEHDEYTFTMKNSSEPIIFDMPQTGRKQDVSNLFFILFFFLTKRIYLKRVKC